MWLGLVQWARDCKEEKAREEARQNLDYLRTERDRLNEALSLALEGQEFYQRQCQSLQEQARTERLEQAPLDELVGALCYCFEQIERRGWKSWSQGTEVKRDGRLYHVQLLVSPIRNE